MAGVTEDISLRIKLDDLKSELAKIPGLTQKEIGKMASAASKEFKRMETDAARSAKNASSSWSAAFSDVGGAMGLAINPATLLTGAIAGVGASVLSLAAHASAAGDAIGQLSARSGLTQRTVLALQSAIRAGGGDAAMLDSAVGKLAGKLSEASKEGSAAAKTFEQYGIAIKDASGKMRSADDVLTDVLDTIANTSNPTEKAALSVELLGQAGNKLAATLPEGAKSLDEWRDKTEALAVAMEAGAKDGAKYNEAMEELNISVEALKLEIGNELMPKIADLASSMAKAVGPAHKFTSSLSYATNLPARGIEGFAKLGKSIRDALDVDGLRAAEAALKNAYAGWEDLADIEYEVADAGEKVAKTHKEIPPVIEEVKKAATKATVAVIEYGAAFNAMVKQAEKARFAENAFADAANATARAQIAKDIAQRDAYNEAIKLAAEYSAFVIAERERIAEAEIVAEEERRRRHEEILAETRAQMDAQIHAILQVASAAETYARLIAEHHEDRLGAIRAEQAEIRAGYAQMTEAEQQQARDRSAILRKQAQEERKKMQRAFAAQKAAAIAGALVSGAQAAVAMIPGLAMAMGPAAAGAPLVAAALAGAATAAQIVAINKQEPKFHRGGSPDEVAATLTRGEAVLSPRGVSAMGGPDGVESLNRGEQPSSGGATVVMLNGRVLDVISSRTTRDGVALRAATGAAKPGSRSGYGI